MPTPTSTIIIEELTGAKRKVELRGPGLPFQGASWSTQQRIASTWNPGNMIEATQQVLGPIELPSEFEGEWNTTRMITMPSYFYDGESASGFAMVRASTLRDVLDGIFYTGGLIRVVWVTSELGEGNFKAPERRVARIGRASLWKFDHERADDIRWSITFDWAGRGQQVQRVVSFRSESMQADLRAALLALGELTAAIDSSKIVASRRETANSADSFTLGDLEAIADGPRQILQDFARLANSVTDRFDRLGKLIQKVRGTPAELLGQVVDVATNAIGVSNRFVDAMSRPAPETLSTQNKISNMLQAVNYYDDAQTQADVVTDANVKVARTLRKHRNANTASTERSGDNAETGDVKAVHITRTGDTFASISTQYYDTPDHGEAIAMNNGFAPYQVEVERGEVIIIPVLSAIERIEATI
jgi:hypothetical protein